MMSHKWFTVSRGASYQRLTQTTTRMISNTSHETMIVGSKSTIQRWINGMIIGSAPFFIILICWMFVSLCINNLVRFYHHRKNRYKHNARNNDIGNTESKINI
jgi:Na+/serine symporter